MSVPHEEYFIWIGPDPKTLDKAGKVCEGQTLQLIKNFWVRALFPNIRLDWIDSPGKNTLSYDKHA